MRNIRLRKDPKVLVGWGGGGGWGEEEERLYLWWFQRYSWRAVCVGADAGGSRWLPPRNLNSLPLRPPHLSSSFSGSSSPLLSILSLVLLPSLSVHFLDKSSWLALLSLILTFFSSNSNKGFKMDQRRLIRMKVSRDFRPRLLVSALCEEAKLFRRQIVCRRSPWRHTMTTWTLCGVVLDYVDTVWRSPWLRGHCAA